MTSPEAQAALDAQAMALRQELAQGLLAKAPLPALQALQARLQLVEQAIAATRPAPAPAPRPPWRAQLIALALVAALVSLAALLPMPRVQFAAEVEAGAAQLTLPQAGRLGGQPLSGELRAEGFSRLESADALLMQRANDEGASPLALRAERLSLRQVTLGAGSRLDVEAGPAAARLKIEAAPHAALFEFGGAVASSLGGAPRVTAQVPVAEWLRLIADGGASELWLPRPAGQVWPWSGLRPSSLRFVERVQDGDGSVRLLSALRSATLRLPAVERDVKAGAGSTLELDGLELEHCELALGDTVRLKLSGSARQIRLATGGFDRSLSPSLLEYAARNHGLGLLWSAAGLLWGISTWLRKQFAVAA